MTQTRVDTTSTFADNLSLPIHRWFRYSAGFSALWVRQVISEEKEKSQLKVLDPFVGSGTVLLESEMCEVEGWGVESHPFVARVAQAKLHWRTDPEQFRRHALSVLEEAMRRKGTISNYPDLIHRCFPEKVLVKLDSLRQAWRNQAEDSPASELTWLAISSILRKCSPVGTAQWQYILPNKKTKGRYDPYEVFVEQVQNMIADMLIRQRFEFGPPARISWDDARELQQIPDNWANLVITSPPYANNYDYADATRLEMTFWGEVESWGDLQEAVRQYLIRSCTQHVSRLISQTDEMLNDPLLDPIRPEITQVCHSLEEVRKTRGGKKPYHTMVAAYFLDLAKVWRALRRVTTEGAVVCFVVGDSAPYGVYVPVDKWLGQLALAAGFKEFLFEKIRDRNIKWKNRKHRVPLKEGRLWVRG